MINTQMTAAEVAQTRLQVDRENKKIGINHEGEKNNLGKDSFLKLLVTELRHQDPTQPMEDKQFIAQMAQFSSLEQMSNLNKEMRSLIRSSRSSEAYGMLGKTIDAFSPVSKRHIRGVVSSISFEGNQPMLHIGSERVSMENIHAVHAGDVRGEQKP